jgi:hypothetical protein
MKIKTNVGENFVLPPLYYPFPSAVNPHAEAAEQHSLVWAERFGIITPAAYQRFLASNFGSFAARTYPTAPREELLIISDWSAWGFLKDDQTDEGEMGRRPEELAALHARFLAVLESDRSTGHDAPLTHALADLGQRLRRKLTPEQMRLFIQTHHDWLAASELETAHRAVGVAPNVADYIHQRQFGGAVYVCFALIELSKRIELPPAVRDHHFVRRLSRTANNAICWCNDLFSLEKELRHGDPANLVIALRAEYGLTLQAAVARVAEMHDAEVRAFLELESRLPSFGAQADALLERYVAGLRSWMRGNFDWSQTTGRYRPLALAA